MKKLLIMALAAVFLIFFTITGVALASDVTGARYHGTLRVSNSANANSDIFTIFELDIDALLEYGYMDDEFDIATITNTGSDTAFMPAVSGNICSLYVPSIGDNGNIDYKLYTGNVTGGEIRYFPGAGGMTTSDSASMEPSDNFTIEISGWIDTTELDIISEKVGAYRFYVSDSGNITAFIADEQNIEQETGDTDHSLYTGSYSRYGVRYDDFPVGFISQVDFYLGKTGAPTGTGYVRVRDVSSDSVIGTLGEINVSTLTGDWASFDTTPIFIDSSQDIRILFEYSGGDAGNCPWIRYWDSNNPEADIVLSRYFGSYVDLSVLETMVRIYWAESDVSVTATGVTSGEHVLELHADSANLSLEIDDVVEDSVALGGASVPDNGNDCVVGSDATPYIEYYEQYTDGILVQHIEWEYDTVFHDLSGYGNDATPTFRTSSSNANVTATLLNFAPTSQARASPEAVSYEGILVDEPPEEIETMYSENNTPGIFFAPLINTLLDVGDIPRTLFWYPAAYFLAILFGALAFRATKQSLLIQAIGEGAMILIFALPGINIYGAWTVIYFGFEAFAVLILSKHFAW